MMWNTGKQGDTGPERAEMMQERDRMGSLLITEAVLWDFSILAVLFAASSPSFLC